MNTFNKGLFLFFIIIIVQCLLFFAFLRLNGFNVKFKEIIYTYFRNYDNNIIGLDIKIYDKGVFGI